MISVKKKGRKSTVFCTFWRHPLTDCNLKYKLLTISTFYDLVCVSRIWKQSVKVPISWQTHRIHYFILVDVLLIAHQHMGQSVVCVPRCWSAGSAMPTCLAVRFMFVVCLCVVFILIHFWCVVPTLKQRAVALSTIAAGPQTALRHAFFSWVVSPFAYLVVTLLNSRAIWLPVVAWVDLPLSFASIPVNAWVLISLTLWHRNTHTHLLTTVGSDQKGMPYTWDSDT